MHLQRLPVGRGKYCWQELLTHSESPPRWLAAFHVSTFTPAQVEFIPDPKGVVIGVTFDSEPTHSIEQQQGGWQAILNHFARHVEANQKKS